MWREIFIVRADGPPWPDVLRLSAPVLIPLVGLGLMGRLMEGVLIALGAYIVLFGAGCSLRRKLAIYVVTAVGMQVAIAIGMVSSASLFALTAAYLVVAAIAVGGDILFALGPPGPYFFVLMVGGGTLLSGVGSGPATVLPYIAIGNLLAIAFGMAAKARPAAGPTAGPTAARETWRSRLRSAITWPSPQLITLARVCVALLAVSVAMRVLDDPHPFWAVLVTVLVLSYPGDRQQLHQRAWQRLVGTSLGIGVFMGLARFPLSQTHYLLLMSAVFLAMGRFTARNYTWGSVLITVFALLLTVPLSPNEAYFAMALSRWRDTLVAFAVALTAVQLIADRPQK